MMARSRERHAGGFTLLEVLVAVAVISLLIVSLVQGVHFGLLAWDVEARLAGKRDGFSTVDDVLRRIVEGTNAGYQDAPAPFVGRSNQLQCITALPGTGHGPSLVMLEVASGHRLVLRWRPYVHAILLKSAPPVNETELLSGVSQIQLSYWRPDSGWVSTWQSAELPTLVRFRLVFPAGEDRHWPDIIAAPLLDPR